jgi:NAD(P)-dependent dehydrogenase (short-subunit alcohol dehydrogenase family)
MHQNIAILGASGAIGMAISQRLSTDYPNAQIHAFSRSGTGANGANIQHYRIDYKDASSIENAASIVAQSGPPDLVFVATGLLHDGDLMPEKSLRDLSADKFQQLFAANTIFPAIAMKHFLPTIAKDQRAVFAAISARVGSISDNRLGGWYAYRASKAALNMLIKNASIEMARRHKQAVIVGLHPGTVDSALSKPFQGHVPDGKLFTPDYSAQQMLSVLETLSAADSGKCFAWDGQEVQA